ncbi:MAG TPA: hypothetical protein VHW00_04960 [Thermoanaerobaculia bacterium]|nr:hypothetical protein [Thermoanaerobaculia bacterium]
MRLVIVLDEDYSSQLEKLAFSHPVWLVDTPANRTAAEQAWHAAIEWPHITVTLFRRQDWDTLLEQIAFQEKRPVEAMEIIGEPLSDPARNAFLDAGYERFDETDRGFRAKK